MTMPLESEILSQLTPDEQDVLRQSGCIAIFRQGLALAISPGSGMAIALRYLRSELAPMVHQARVGPATPPPRNPLSTPRRGVFQSLEVEGVEVDVIRFKEDWRCPTSNLSAVTHPTGARAWLGEAIARETEMVVQTLRPLGFVGVTEVAIAPIRGTGGKKRSPRFKTLSEADTRIILKNRKQICPPRRQASLS